MIPILLFFVARFAWLFKLLKVDVVQIKTIVGTKLLMDTRRSALSFGRARPESQNSFLLALFFYCIVGGAMSLLFHLPLASALTIFQSFVMVMIIMILISDFSAVLLDTSDNTIILPRPVESRTLLVARITHILLYLSQVWFSIIIIPFFVFAFKHSISSALILLVTTFLSVVASVFFTVVIYLVLMRFASEERLKTIINYAQIAMAILVMGGYQILPRFMNLKSLEAGFVFSSWSLLVPPMWMAGMQEMLALRVFDNIHILLTILALVVPIYGLYLVTVSLSPYFSKKLSDLGNGSSVKVKNTLGTKFWQRIAKLVSFSALEQASFLFVSTIASRDRKFKLRVYPALGYTFIMAIIFLIPKGSNPQSVMQSLSESKNFITLYLAFLIAQTVIFESLFSDDFRSAWIYYVGPVSTPGEIVAGSIKSLVVKYFIPMFLILSSGLVFVWGVRIIPDLILAFFNNLCATFCIVLVGDKNFPFSLEPNMRNQSGSFFRMFVIIIISGITGLVHYFIAKLPYGSMGFLMVSVVLFLVLERQVRKISWEDFSQ